MKIYDRRKIWISASQLNKSGRITDVILQIVSFKAYHRIASETLLKNHVKSAHVLVLLFLR